MNREQYDTLASAVEQGLMKHYPLQRWHVARFGELIALGEIKDEDDFPTWLVVEATTRNAPGRIRLKIGSEVIRKASTIHSLVHAIRRQFDEAPHLALEMALLLTRPYGDEMRRSLMEVVRSERLQVEDKHMWWAKMTLMRRLGIDEQQAAALIAQRAQEKDVSPETVAQLIVSANDFLKLMPWIAKIKPRRDEGDAPGEQAPPTA
jgi:hypothetical protein